MDGTEQNFEISDDQDCTVSLQLAQILISDFQYRHKAYWSFFGKSAFAIVMILITPFFSEKYLSSIAQYYLFFPILALIVTVSATLILKAEQVRLHWSAKRAFMVVNKLLERSIIAGDVSSYEEYRSTRGYFSRMRVAKALYIFTLVAGTIASVLQIYLFLYVFPAT